MLTPSTVEIVASGLAFCCTCQKPASVVNARAATWSHGWEIVLACHGSHASAFVSEFDIELRNADRVASALRVFLRPWAKHGELGQAGRLLRAGRNGMHPC